MILLDTSVLIDALSGPRRSATALRGSLEAGERIVLATLVLYEWRRGPRIREEIQAQEALFPGSAALGFGPEEAVLAAELYSRLHRPRGRDIDIALAAVAVRNNATIWTLNESDFADIPGLDLYRPRADSTAP